jgi:hypothetical protein
MGAFIADRAPRRQGGLTGQNGQAQLVGDRQGTLAPGIESG